MATTTSEAAMFDMWGAVGLSKAAAIPARRVLICGIYEIGRGVMHYLKLTIVCFVMLMSYVQHGAFASDGQMTETRLEAFTPSGIQPKKIWDGPVTDIHRIGSEDQWQGHWSNNYHEERTLIITINFHKKKASIKEVESNQEWISDSCTQNADHFIIDGHEKSYLYYFSANLWLEKPSNIDSSLSLYSDEMTCF